MCIRDSPYVVEPSLGADRVALAFLCEAYDEEVVDAGKNDTRVVMRLHPALAPFKACVLPLSKKLAPKAEEVRAELAKYFMVDYDETGSIGKLSLIHILQEMLYRDGACVFEWRPVRPIPKDDDFFENVWREYRETGNVG